MNVNPDAVHPVTAVRLSATVHVVPSLDATTTKSLGERVNVDALGFNVYVAMLMGEGSWSWSHSPQYRLPSTVVLYVAPEYVPPLYDVEAGVQKLWQEVSSSTDLSNAFHGVSLMLLLQKEDAVAVKVPEMYELESTVAGPVMGPGGIGYTPAVGNTNEVVVGDGMVAVAVLVALPVCVTVTDAEVVVVMVALGDALAVLVTESAALALAEAVFVGLPVTTFAVALVDEVDVWVAVAVTLTALVMVAAEVKDGVGDGEDVSVGVPDPLADPVPVDVPVGVPVTLKVVDGVGVPLLV
ncbi:hypothetical protein [Silvimonas sp.]|uniref:hypothetical protein n=1 Tax=Silvimonas sp. TaxID=2650811 RepID=UPI00284A9531|nr:hypothetical protein [Silvimonas sp.]MDR3426904.1 hypothetical protein [Silvimonas sp.]